MLSSSVILEAPVGQSSDVWALVEPLIAKRTKVKDLDCLLYAMLQVS